MPKLLVWLPIIGLLVVFLGAAWALAKSSSDADKRAGRAFKDAQARTRDRKERVKRWTQLADESKRKNVDP